MGRIMAGQWRDLTLQKVVRGLDSRNIILPTVVWGTCFAEPDTFSVSKDYCGVFGEGTRLAMPKTICAPDTSTLKHGSGATDRVLY